MTTMTKQEIIEAAWEGINGLSIGWGLANVKDPDKRAELQAPIIAGQKALMELIKALEN